MLSETAARNVVAELAKKEESRIHKTLRDKQTFVVIDEPEINGQKFIYFLLGDIAVSTVTILAECCPLKNSVNNTTVTHIVDDVLRKHGTRREKFLFLLSDAACCMCLVGKTLKELYSCLMHVTCITHLIQNCAMRIRAYFKEIDYLVALVKAATIKNKN